MYSYQDADKETCEVGYDDVFIPILSGLPLFEEAYEDPRDAAEVAYRQKKNLASTAPCGIEKFTLVSKNEGGAEQVA